MSMNAVANRGKLVDAECYLHGSASGPVTIGGRGATGVTGNGYGATGIGGAALIFDTGGGFTEMLLVIDLATCSTLTTHGGWLLRYQLSDSAAMATPIWDRPLMHVGGNGPTVAVRYGWVRNTRDTAQYGNTRARHIIPINNDYGGTCYRYLRLVHQCKNFTAASVDFGLHYSAFISVMP